jgi:hypothetical protein
MNAGKYVPFLGLLFKKVFYDMWFQSYVFLTLPVNIVFVF